VQGRARQRQDQRDQGSGEGGPEDHHQEEGQEDSEGLMVAEDHDLRGDTARVAPFYFDKVCYN